MSGRPYDSFDVFVGTDDDNSHIGLESQMYGFRGDDWLVSSSGATPASIWGGRGNDTIDGGTAGGDYLYGGRGNDTVIGSGSDDYLYGGRGHDTFVIHEGDEATIKDFQPKKDFVIVQPDPDLF